MTDKQLHESIIDILYKWVHDKDEYGGLKKMPTNQLLTLQNKALADKLREVRGLQKELQECKLGKFCSAYQSHNILAYLDSKIWELK